MDSIASSSVGFSGAELANVVNEAVFLALRQQRSRPSPKDFAAALERRKAARKAAQGGEDFARAMRIWPKAAAA